MLAMCIHKTDLLLPWLGARSHPAAKTAQWHGKWPLASLYQMYLSFFLLKYYENLGILQITE